LLPALVAWTALAAVAAAQPPGGQLPDPGAPDAGLTASLRGEVRSPDGEPLAGARVRLEPFEAAGARTVDVVTGKDGRWRRGSLAVGQWRITVEADGYRTTTGQVQVALDPNAPVEVALEVDSDAAVRSWLEQGNRMLESNKPAAARAFYEQAVTVVRGAQAGEIQARRLLRGVLAGVGREAEAIDWLTAVDRDGFAPLIGGSASGPEIPRRPLEERPTGRFRTTIDTPSPLSELEVLLERNGTPKQLGVDPDAAWTLEGETFEVYVPPLAAGDESADQRPYGLFVWVSPTPRGGVTDEEMLPVLDAERTIWIGANGAGNPRVRGDRTRLALDAAAAAMRTYPVDPERVYVGGYSGGGRMASSLALLYPEVFTGGVYFMGVDFYRAIPVPHRPGTMWTPWMKPPTAEALARVRARSRFVFVTGTHDFNRAETLAYRREYEREGFDRVTLIDIPDVGHYYGFRARELRAALRALEPLAP
jgi:pimeloyl-ACP methyl ester carboxylesterase